MKYDPSVHHRRSIRLLGYDYSQNGAYFITVCTRDHQSLFGYIVDCEMQLNDAGVMVQTVWDEIPLYYPGIEIDEFIIMPNHIHGIVVIVGAGPRACPEARACPDFGQSNPIRAGIRTGAINRATTGGCPYGIIVAGRGASIQNHDHQTIR